MTTTFVQTNQQATSSKELQTSTVPLPSQDIRELLLGMATEGLSIIYHEAAERLIRDKAVAHVMKDEAAISFLVPSELPSHAGCIGVLYWLCAPYSSVQELEQAHVHMTLVSTRATSSNAVGVEIDLSSRLYLGSIEMQTFFQAQQAIEGASSNFFPLLDVPQDDSIVMPEHPTQQ